MKTACLWLLLFAAPALIAQEPAREAAQPPSTPQQTYSQQQPAAQPAPTPGHPLDPADVATLTRRSETSIPAVYRTPYGAPAPYYPLDMWGSGYRGASPFGSQSFFFGGFGHNRSFFFFGNGPFLPFMVFPGLGRHHR